MPRLPDPASYFPDGERRRTVRQRLHTPVYASFNGSQTGMVVDLSELIDLHEDGFAVQTAIQSCMSDSHCLKVNQSVTLCLDLPETRSFIHGSGQVVWNDDTGRAGIRFTFLPGPARQVLKQWLFTNLLVASTNHTARSRQLSLRQLEGTPAATSITDSHARDLPAQDSFGQKSLEDCPPERNSPDNGSRGDAQKASNSHDLAQHASTTDVEARPPHAFNPQSPAPADLVFALSDVRRQIREIETRASEVDGVDGHIIDGDLGADAESDRSDPVLQLIADRALSLTGATGAALALLANDKMMCRARVGHPAPPLQSIVNVTEGLSGICVRSGMLVVCDNPETDRRVDSVVCRTLGIGSFMAVPIFADFRVVGILEVFSLYGHAFTDLHGTVMERLVELVPKHGPLKIHTSKVEGKTRPESIAPNLAEQSVVHADRTEVNTVEPARAKDPVLDRAGIERSPEPMYGVQALREALWQDVPMDELQAPTTEEKSTRVEVSDFTSISDHAAQQTSPRVWETEPEDKPEGRRRLSQLGLLAAAIVVVFMVVGYLLSSVIERRWANPQSSAAHSSVSPIAWQVSANSKPQAMSPQDLRKLAEQGDADAQYQMGLLYHNGEGVAQSDFQAVQWFQRAAEQGYVRAQAALGAYYWAGRGVAPDFSKAYFWSRLALAQGDEGSKSRLEGLSTQMTPSQVANASQQAEAWLQAHNQPVKSNPRSN